MALKLLIPLILIVIGYNVGTVAFTIHHEYAHKDIFRITGFENITISYQFDGFSIGGQTTGRITPETDLEAGYEMTMWNEIIGHHTSGLISNLWFMFVVLIATIIIVVIYVKEEQDFADYKSHIRHDLQEEG